MNWRDLQLFYKFLYIHVYLICIINLSDAKSRIACTLGILDYVLTLIQTALKENAVVTSFNFQKS